MFENTVLVEKVHREYMTIRGEEKLFGFHVVSITNHRGGEGDRVGRDGEGEKSRHGTAPLHRGRLSAWWRTDQILGGDRTQWKVNTKSISEMGHHNKAGFVIFSHTVDSVERKNLIFGHFMMLALNPR